MPTTSTRSGWTVYQTYRRMDVPSTALSLIYYLGVILVLLIVFPVLMLRPGLAHMKKLTLEVPGSQVAVTSFVAPAEPPNLPTQSDMADDIFFREVIDLRIAEAHRKCLKRRRCHGGNVAASTTDCRCEYWDWMELVDGSTHQLHLATSIHDVVESRRTVNKSSGETRALASWRPLEDTRDTFFTVDPEHLVIRWLQRLSLGRVAQHTVGDGGEGGRSLRGILTSSEVCDQLRSGASIASIIMQHTSASGSVAAIPLSGSGDDTFTLVDLLRVLPTPQTPATTEEAADPAMRRNHYLRLDSPTLGGTTLGAGAQQDEWYLEEWVARDGIELQITAEFLNTIAPLDDTHGTIGHRPTVSLSSLFQSFTNGPLQYMVCVTDVAAASRVVNHNGKEDNGKHPSPHHSLGGVYAMFTAPADWSRRGLPTKLGAKHGSANMSGDGGRGGATTSTQMEARLLRKVFGARLHFSAHVTIAVFDVSALLQFIGTTLGFLGTPWLVTELLIGFCGRMGRRAPPRWFKDFLLSPVEEGHGGERVPSTHKQKSS
jgi:hypothetical protein